MIRYTQILHLGSNQSGQRECLIFITFPVDTAIGEYHYTTWALLFFVATLNLTHKRLTKDSEDIETDALKTFCDGKANQATKQRDQNLLQGNSLLKKDYKLSQQCT